MEQRHLHRNRTGFGCSGCRCSCAAEGQYARLGRLDRSALGLIWSTLVLGAGMIANVAVERATCVAPADFERAVPLWETLHAVELYMGDGKDYRWRLVQLCQSRRIELSQPWQDCHWRHLHLAKERHLRGVDQAQQQADGCPPAPVSLDSEGMLQGLLQWRFLSRSIRRWRHQFQRQRQEC